MNLSRHFPYEEFVRSKRAAREGIVQTPTAEQLERGQWLAVHVLELIRISLMRAMHTSSWLRTPEVNRLEGGARDSAHLYGAAWDGEVLEMSNLALAQHIRKMNLREIDQLVLEYPSKDDPRAGWIHLGVTKRRGEIPRGQVLTVKMINGEKKTLEGLTI